jgi:hypothetical protein
VILAFSHIQPIFIWFSYLHFIIFCNL